MPSAQRSATMKSMSVLSTDLLVVGAGPAGSSAAAWAARQGIDVVLADAAAFPRDKACGDGLTPRAIAELDRLGMTSFLQGRVRNWGLRTSGFGQTLFLPWPGGAFPSYGSAVPRTVLDDAIRNVALDAGATARSEHRAIEVRRSGDRVTGVVFHTPSGASEVACRRLVVADGARSQLGRHLGREWHKQTAYGVAARSYAKSERSDDPWITSHLELRDADGQILSGYGWVFPLGDGEVNIGVGTLATDDRPADVNLRNLMGLYAEQQRDDWRLHGTIRAAKSALLPMGGAVSGVAGANWLLVGDAAGCVNPLNGEGIDYGLETGRLAAELMAGGTSDLAGAWPALLREHYGQAFSIARRLAGLLTVPRLLPTLGPVGMRSTTLMKVAFRVMANLVTDEDLDTTARAWRAAGRVSNRLDDRIPFS